MLVATAIGVCAVLAVEASLIYGIGIRVAMPTSQVAVISTAVSRHLQRAWPAMRRTTLASLKPLMHEEVNRMVGEITVDVGGAPVRLPRALRAQIADHIDRLLESNLESYLVRQFNPGAIVTPKLVKQALSQPLLLHVWVRAWHIPVPVTIVLSARP